MFYIPDELFNDIKNSEKVYKCLKDEPILFSSFVIEPREVVLKRVSDKIRELGEFKVADYLENDAIYC